MVKYYCSIWYTNVSFKVYCVLDNLIEKYSKDVD